MNKTNVEKLIYRLLSELESNPDREGLWDTPSRVAKAYAETLSGYDRSLASEMTVFKNEYGYKDIIYSGKINFYSTCEHHLLPFFGEAHIAYIPKDKIAGISKLARAIDIFARRLQEQERITVQVANELEKVLEPLGVAVMLNAKHFCNMSRGVHQQDFELKTFAYRGNFADSTELKSHFLRLM